MSCHQLRAPPWAKGAACDGQTHHCLTKCLRRPSGWDESLWKWAREPEMKVSLAGLVLWHAPLTAGLVVRPLSGFSQRTSVGT